MLRRTPLIKIAASKTKEMVQSVSSKSAGDWLTVESTFLISIVKFPTPDPPRHEMFTIEAARNRYSSGNSGNSHLVLY